MKQEQKKLGNSLLIIERKIVITAKQTKLKL